MTAAMAPWPYPLWIAHRGAGRLAPENTLAAFRVGASHGYRAFECDVKLSADGVPFLLHDTTLQRTTNARGTAGERPWSELSRLDAGGWHSRAYAGEPIPSFEALARWCVRNGHALDIEIKPTPGQEVETGRAVARETLRLWAEDRSGSAVPPFVTSFRPESLQGAREAAPDVRRGLLLDTLWDGWFDVARSLGCGACVTNYNLMDHALIERLHGAGLRALVYTVNDPAEAQRLVGLGIDGIVTDAVDRFAPGSAVFD
jgi:glycerophosphoryl diester phosphodiesterase